METTALTLLKDALYVAIAAESVRYPPLKRTLQREAARAARSAAIALSPAEDAESEVPSPIAHAEDDEMPTLEEASTESAPLGAAAAAPASLPPASPMVVAPPASVAPSSTRGSQYQEFISRILPTVRRLYPGRSPQTNMREVAAIWQKHKWRRELDVIVAEGVRQAEQMAAAAAAEANPLRTASVFIPARDRGLSYESEE